MNPNFSWLWNTAKGSVMGLGGGAVGLVIAWLMRGWNGGDFTLSPEEGAALALVSAWVAAQGKNILKHVNWKWTNYIPVVLIGMLAVGGQGCNTLAPAVGGKTKIETTFSDVVGADGVQNTNYSQKLEAPAGVEAKDLASMTYDWKGDGSGAIAVSSDRDANTTMQADLLKAAFDANTAQSNMLLQTLLGLGGLASPLIGQKIDLDAAQKAQESVNKASFQNSIMDWMKTVLPGLVQQQLEAQAATRASESNAAAPANPGAAANPLADVPIPNLVPSLGGTN